MILPLKIQWSFRALVESLKGWEATACSRAVRWLVGCMKPATLIGGMQGWRSSWRLRSWGSLGVGRCLESSLGQDVELLDDGFLRGSAPPAPAAAVLAETAPPAQSQASTHTRDVVAGLGLHAIGRIGCWKRDTSWVKVFTFLIT